MKVLEVRDFEPARPADVYLDSTLIRVRKRFLWWTWEVTYVGGGTVWHEYPNGRRASTLMESVLSDIEQRHEWEKYQ